MPHIHTHLLLLITLITLTASTTNKQNDEEITDINDQHHPHMIYVGRMTSPSDPHSKPKRIPHNYDNTVHYIFGTGFDSHHAAQLDWDLHLQHFGAFANEDLADRSHRLKHTNDEDLLQYIKSLRHGVVSKDGMPRRYNEVDVNVLDGGVTPPKFVQVEPFFMDEVLVSNKEFAKFVAATKYETEAEVFGWSFVLRSYVRRQSLLHSENGYEVDPEAVDWVALEGAQWRMPEGPGSSYGSRMDHPVVHVSHRDAAEYCQWVGKRLPGEREYEAAARAGRFHGDNRTLYSWGDEDEEEFVAKYANLWQGEFPDNNTALDGWRATSPVRHFKPNDYGFYDTIGNVWEWMRGGKKKARIVRGASFVDSADGHINHAATLGARATLHGSTGTANVGFRCAKSPKLKDEYTWVYHDEEIHGTLGIEDEFGAHHAAGVERGWEDRYDPYRMEDDDDFLNNEEDEDGYEDWDGYVTEITVDEKTGKKTKRKKRKVLKPRMRASAEL